MEPIDISDYIDVFAKLPITCDCGHKFKISAVGLDSYTDIICPKCGVTAQLDDATIDSLEKQWQFYVDNGPIELMDKFMDLMEADPVKVARITDDGFD